nr:MAG TPA: hypothetical protein [Inoviridae sp.]
MKGVLCYEENVCCCRSLHGAPFFFYCFSVC